jgi:hypothetical protein
MKLQGRQDDSDIRKHLSSTRRPTCPTCNLRLKEAQAYYRTDRLGSDDPSDSSCPQVLNTPYPQVGYESLVFLRTRLLT